MLRRPHARSSLSSNCSNRGQRCARIERHGFGGASLGDDAYFAGGNKGCGGGDMTDELLLFRLR